MGGIARCLDPRLCLACDLIVIEEHALIGLPEVRRGIIAGAGAGGVERLARRIPPSIALECILTGEPLTAQRAYDVGLTNRVAATGTGVDAALELAEAICEGAPLAVRYSKAIARATFRVGELEARHAAAELRELWWNSEDRARRSGKASSSSCSYADLDFQWEGRPPGMWTNSRAKPRSAWESRYAHLMPVPAMCPVWWCGCPCGGSRP